MELLVKEKSDKKSSMKHLKTAYTATTEHIKIAYFPTFDKQKMFLLYKIDSIKPYSTRMPYAIEYKICTLVGNVIIPDSKTNALTKSVPVCTRILPTTVRKKVDALC